MAFSFAMLYIYFYNTRKEKENVAWNNISGDFSRNKNDKNSIDSLARHFQDCTCIPKIFSE